MTGEFATAGLKEFALTLDEIAESMHFVSTAAKLRPRLDGILNYGALQGDLARLTKEFINFKNLEVTTQFRGMSVVIMASFEQLVRRIAEDAIAHINKSFPIYEKIPEGIKVQNIFFTGRALCTVREPLDHIAVDHTSLGANLATCTTGAASFKLNQEAFAMFITNLTPSHLSDVCRSIGVKFDWDHFGKIKDFEEICGTRGTRLTAKAITERLSEFVRLRNRIAHTGTGGITVTEEQITSQLAFFRVLGPRLATFVALNLPKP